jgi:hypothetical protein
VKTAAWPNLAGFYMPGRDKFHCWTSLGWIAGAGSSAGRGYPRPDPHVHQRPKGGQLAMSEKKITMYLYTRYERFWHWLQMALIFVLLVTGFEVHGSFPFLGFQPGCGCA